ncbi:hypothetical protein H8E88_28235 [candidate division KSB1 bacterium]|nr:hypothetical protein [candidate division KSB1 bacterium]
MKSIFSIFILIFLLLNSCTPVYRPNPLNTPLFTEKGQANIGMYYGPNGTDLQVSYALTNKIGIIANGSYLSMRPEENNQYPNNISAEENDNYQKNLFWELGVGYFKKQGKNVVSEIYIGAGRGESSAKSDYEPISSMEVMAKSRYYRFFVQSNVAFKSTWFEGGFCLRSCYVNFYELEFENKNYPYSKWNTFVDPVLFMRLGEANLKFQVQYGYSIPVTMNNPIEYVPFVAGIGLNIGF